MAYVSCTFLVFGNFGPDTFSFWDRLLQIIHQFERDFSRVHYFKGLGTANWSKKTISFQAQKPQCWIFSIQSIVLMSEPIGWTLIKCLWNLNWHELGDKWALFETRKDRSIITYRKIPYISPGLIEVCKPSLGGAYIWGNLYSGGGADIGRAFCVSVRV